MNADERARRCVLAVDLGGSSPRVALIGRAGAVRARHTIPQHIRIADDGGTEADPEDWWRGLQQGAAVAVTAFARSLVLLDQAGQVLRPGMLWQDHRAEAALWLHGKLFC